MSQLENKKIAIVHDWLVTRGGAERVLECMLDIFPDADLFTVVDFYSDEDRAFIKGKRAVSTFIQKLPKAKEKYRNYLPLMPIAIEQLDLRGYDVVISSSHAVAKGVLVGPDQCHVSYVHSPIRYAWDLQSQYLKEANLDSGIKSILARWMLHKIRLWDARSIAGVDAISSNSKYISRRITKVYRRNSTVIYPPVDTEAFEFCAQKDDFYLTASRMVPYKKIPAIVEAFREMPDKRLIVVGNGPDFDKVKALAAPNIEILGRQPFSKLVSLMQHAKGFVFNAEEDFGIVPVEAQACGTPVIAFGRGGATESVNGIDSENPTGLFYTGQDSTSIIEGIKQFEKSIALIDPIACRENALKFSAEKFRANFFDFVTASYSEFRDAAGLK